MDLRQQSGRGNHKALDPDVLATNPRPSCRMHAHVEMEKAAIIGADSPAEEGRDLQRQFVHLLQRKARNRYVGSHTSGMFAVGDPANFLVVRGATIPVVDHNGLSGERAKMLESYDQRVVNLQLPTTVAGKL